jgi:hypothetical protein
MKTYNWDKKWTIKVPVQLTSIEHAILSSTAEGNEEERKNVGAAIMARSEAEMTAAEITKLESFLVKKLELKSKTGLEFISCYFQANIEEDLIFGNVIFRKNDKTEIKNFN